MKRLLFLSLAAVALLAQAQEIRPVRDDIGFCWQHAQLARLMSLLDADPRPLPASSGIVAAISPHDDFLYAGRVYYPLFRRLLTKEAVIFGVTHGMVRKEIGDPQGILILDDFPAWAGLGAPVAISPLRERLKLGLAKGDFIVSNNAHSLEHSIEALLPWLQFANPGIRITPIMVTAMPYARMEELSGRLAAVLAAYIEENRLQPGRDIVFLISADANHYGRDFDNTPYGEDEQAHARGTREDRRIAAGLVEGTTERRKDRETDARALGHHPPRSRERLLVRQIRHPLRTAGHPQDRAGIRPGAACGESCSAIPTPTAKGSCPCAARDSASPPHFRRNTGWDSFRPHSGCNDRRNELFARFFVE